MDVPWRWRACVHEAGHSVAARLLLVPGCGRASAIVPDRAYAEFDEGCGWPSVVALMSGAVAEEIILGGYDAHGVADDCARWTAWLEYLGVDDEALWAHAFELLRPYEDLIVRLAAELWDARSLEGDEIDALVFGSA